VEIKMTGFRCLISGSLVLAAIMLAPSRALPQNMAPGKGLTASQAWTAIDNIFRQHLENYASDGAMSEEAFRKVEARVASDLQAVTRNVSHELITGWLSDLARLQAQMNGTDKPEVPNMPMTSAWIKTASSTQRKTMGELLKELRFEAASLFLEVREARKADQEARRASKAVVFGGSGSPTCQQV
jgi:hypothetical protein